MKGPILKGSRVTLRTDKLSDAPFFAKWFKDKEVTIFLTMGFEVSLAAEYKFIRRTWRKDNPEITWAIENENKELMGNISVRPNVQNKSAVLGIVIGNKQQWGKGYGQEAMQLVIDYSFRKFGINRLELNVYAGNKRARALYKKVGLRVDGFKRQAHWNKILKKFEDDVIMSILRAEWLKKNHLKIK